MSRPAPTPAPLNAFTPKAVKPKPHESKGYAIDLGTRTAPVELRVNKRAKRLILKVDPVQGRILLTVPSKSAIAQAMAFAQSRAGWIAQQLTASAGAKPFMDGGTCPYRGAIYTLKSANAPRARTRITKEPSQNADDVANQGEITVGGEAAHLNRRLVDWLKIEARRVFTERSDFYAAKLQARRGPIAIRDMRTRWGSCSREGALSYSWRLILAPRWILDYVAAHECAHLRHLDHSPAYWRLLASLDVDADAARAWFRDHGEKLYGYGVLSQDAGE